LAIALEQVRAGTAAMEYADPDLFFARTMFTRALREHAGFVLCRLSGEAREYFAKANLLETWP
jgi:predicted AAA+ superfamily ATPase